MQTFLPYESFLHSAKCLDNKRLGKQRVECKQILLTLAENRKAWSNHPAVLMWKSYENALCLYAIIVCNVWIGRGFEDSCKDFFVDYRNCLGAKERIQPKFPPWLGGKIHNTHRSNLLRKDPKYYGKFGWNVSNDLPYYWPVRKEHYV